jgi:phage head maturation protease
MDFVPRGVTPGQTQTRFASTKPTSYSSESRTVDAVISMGSPVVRFYGTEKLRITPDAVIVDRVASSGVPVLDSHQQTGISNALGRITKVWFVRSALMGTIAFNDTPEGRKAEGMVARGEIAGISAGYTVREWEIADANGKVLDPDVQRINFDDDLTFTATRWELLECSLVSVPADSAAMVRSMGGGNDRQIIADVQARMLARHRISLRQSMYDDLAALDD